MTPEAKTKELKMKTWTLTEEQNFVRSGGECELLCVQGENGDKKISFFPNAVQVGDRVTLAVRETTVFSMRPATKNEAETFFKKASHVNAEVEWAELNGNTKTECNTIF